LWSSCDSHRTIRIVYGSCLDFEKTAFHFILKKGNDIISDRLFVANTEKCFVAIYATFFLKKSDTSQFKIFAKTGNCSALNEYSPLSYLRYVEACLNPSSDAIFFIDIFNSFLLFWMYSKSKNIVFHPFNCC